MTLSTPQLTTPTITTPPTWATLPKTLRQTPPSNLTSHSINQKRGRPLDSFLEGPIYIQSLNLLFLTDIPYGRIFTIDPTTAQWSLFLQYDGEPNGLAYHHITKKILIADFKNGILELDPVTKNLRTIVSRYHGERLKGPNDLVVDSKGVVYFTDQGMTGLHDATGRVFRLFLDENYKGVDGELGGRLEMIISNGPSPNGLVLSRDESALFVAMTRDNSIWYVPFMLDGSVQRVGRFASYYGIGGPDGMAIDSEGNILVAHSTLGRVFVHDKSGEMKIVIKSEKGASTTNLTWGVGESGSLDTLYIVESEMGEILKVDWHCKGWLVKGLE
ncbi:SMP-30/gluconolactonase/LRE family protein [Aspergillus luchuensis]|uniref:Gluconolactonase n=1 Tax=Aspergillus kawachii TaxID=1069201 RepID=A0A146FSP5_ASPKA|nr:uncharacterized protein AKAW2_80774A [Aspergillus luchuensis]BCS04973.1 hypothetical protein AKAW2_80774A [Aspergillus luchuensis]BCS16534.1 hypothetical protein ALUC_80741A [Aspergillus luchuensis]GAT28152.1 gluconolactonase [Aspergillus luchuensis]